MLKAIFGIFSQYVHPFEKKADKFFRKIKSHHSSAKTHKKLENLMQENLIVLNLWMEKKYKNYVYLKKRVRRKMYEDVEILKEDFLRFAKGHKMDDKKVAAKFKTLGVSFPNQNPEHLKFLVAVMAYLRPGKRFLYQESANFGKLLKNPLEEKLVGDCNQIVTLYSFLYSLKYPIKELQIKILPGHVCLHFRGMDIEATSGTFKHYSKHDGVLPITELITTNLLDVADAEAKTKKIDQRVMLKRAHLAYLVSSKRELVERNLEIAYRNLGAKLMNEKKFDSAIFYLEKLKDPKLLNMAYHNGAIYFLKRKNFRRARYFAKRSGKDDLLRACYMGEYREVSKKVRGIKSISKAKTYKATYRKMLNLARKGGDNKAEASVRKILKQL